MMLEEFEQRTGIYPTAEMYRIIEQFYTNFDGDKDVFCEAYKENKEWLAERIQRVATEERCKNEDFYKKTQQTYVNRIADLEKELEREQEWRPYVDTDNVSQSDYDKLVEAGGSNYMTEEEAKDLLYNWFGFAKEKVTVYTEIPKYEVNRHGNLRKVGTIDRRPAYNATDWNYIRFDCGCMAYELYNDNLRFFIF